MLLGCETATPFHQPGVPGPEGSLPTTPTTPIDEVCEPPAITVHTCLTSWSPDAADVEQGTFTDSATVDLYAEVVGAGALEPMPGLTSVPPFQDCADAAYLLLLRDDAGGWWNFGFWLEPDAAGDLHVSVQVGATARLWSTFSSNWEVGASSRGVWLGASDGTPWFAAGDAGTPPMDLLGVTAEALPTACPSRAEGMARFEPGPVDVEVGAFGVVDADPPLRVFAAALETTDFETEVFWAAWPAR